LGDDDCGFDCAAPCNSARRDRYAAVIVLPRPNASAMRDLAGRPLTNAHLLDAIAEDGGAVVSRGLTDSVVEIGWRQTLTDAGAERGMHLLFTGYDVVGIIDILAPDFADRRQLLGASNCTDEVVTTELVPEADRSHPSRSPRLRLLPGGLGPDP